MPMVGVERPAIGISLLKAHLARLGVACDLRYLNWTFAERIGLETFGWVSDWKVVPHDALVGEWLFTDALYGPDAERTQAYIDVLAGDHGLPTDTLDRLVALRDACTDFIDECVGAIAWDDYDIVGFTSTFEQNVASLALARRIKERHPGVRIVFGGANWEGEMGETLHRLFPFVDAACLGEADESFPALVTALLGGGDVAAVPGIVHRVDGESVTTGAPGMIRDLDVLPYPDYDDFFAAASASPLQGVTPIVLIQTARGCWWGERSHCTFCGLNGGTMSFRSKSPERTLAELRYLRDRYGIRTIDTVDEILDMRYMRSLLPAIAREDLDVDLFYEVKANLTHRQVAQMAAGRITNIQPGIESLSDHVLELMAKGTTAIKNIQLLKWCREYGITVYWNLLYGIPSETQADYDEIERIIRRIWYLDPPTGGAVQLRLDRFSPYHNNPAAYGIVGVRASKAYAAVYQATPEELDGLAYYFDFTYTDGRPSPGAYAERVAALVGEWTADTDRGELAQRFDGEGRLVLTDTRGGVDREVVLEGWRAVMYQACDRARTREELATIAVEHQVPEAEVDAFLDELDDDALVLRHAGAVLALAVHRPACPLPPPAPAELTLAAATAES